jgi:glycosyltransferase involved in cell wall biosynthesis
MTPVVSVIVTTYRRPLLMTRAVRSVLAQTLQDLEVVVVLDGPDDTSLAALSSIEDRRVRIHVRPEQGGQPAAINTGVTLARASWIALLDDDDEWMPEKLAVQLTCAQPHLRETVVGCRFVARSEFGDVCWPLRNPRAGERIADYLFCRNRLGFGEGILPTSVLFAPSKLFHAHPMNERLRNHCDLDWMIALDACGVSWAMPDEQGPLAIWHMQHDRDRLSNSHDWHFSCDWIAGVRSLITSRAYAGFLLTWVSASARAQGDYSAVPFLLREAFRSGSPSLRELAIYGAMWAMPMRFRRRASRAMTL